MNAKILVVDDDQELRDLVDTILRGAGFDVLLASNGREGLQKVYRDRPDLILLDVQMQEMDGHTMCQRVREMGSEIPIIILSAFGDAVNKVLGLEEGADDYVAKPFESRELIARINAVLRRRVLGNTQMRQFQDKKLSIDFDGLQLWVNAEPVELTPKEWRLLACLFKHRGRMLSHEELLREVWGKGHEGAHSLLKVHVSHLRGKMRDDARKPRYILSVRGSGYRFMGGGMIDHR